MDQTQQRSFLLYLVGEGVAGLHGIRLCRISGRARPPDGRAISLDQRAGRPHALASQGALTYHCGKVEPADCHSLKGSQK